MKRLIQEERNSRIRFWLTVLGGLVAALIVMIGCWPLCCEARVNGDCPDFAIRLRAVEQVLKDITEFLVDFAAEFYPDITHVVEEQELDGDTR